MTLLNELTQLTQTFGDTTNNYVIVGEGNTSARIDSETFYVKASGQQMGNISETGFVAVQFAPILKMLEGMPTADEQKAILNSAKINSNESRSPSIETSFHGMLLHECDVNFVGHTHPTAINQILCSSRAEHYAKNRHFPDEVVLCGPESVLVDYASPGLILAKKIRAKVRAYIKEWGTPPKVILLKNHGLIVIGNTAKEVMNITAMAVKSAEIYVGACAIGDPVPMTRSEIMEIYERPDEHYRLKQFVEDE